MYSADSKICVVPTDGRSWDTLITAVTFATRVFLHAGFPGRRIPGDSDCAAAKQIWELPVRVDAGQMSLGDAVDLAVIVHAAAPLMDLELRQRLRGLAFEVAHLGGVHHEHPLVCQRREVVDGARKQRDALSAFVRLVKRAAADAFCVMQESGEV